MELLTEPICDPYFMGDEPVVVIEMEGGQEIRIELYPFAAPITVSYFLTLVNEGFYDGLQFHRLAPNFVLQGGDPTGTGDGETEYYLKGEFAENGVDNPLLHTAGALSMARQEGCDTASCQFFIMLRNAPALDGHYAAFGHAIDGMDVIEELAATPVDENAVPVTPLVMKRVYIEG